MGRSQSFHLSDLSTPVGRATTEAAHLANETGPANVLPYARVLVPFDRREGVTIEEAAACAGRDVRTLRRWCIEHGIGRRIAGGPWTVSRVALAMLLNGDRRALRLYLAGDRNSSDVSSYFVDAGLADLLQRWNSGRFIEA